MLFACLLCDSTAYGGTHIVNPVTLIFFRIGTIQNYYGHLTQSNEMWFILLPPPQPFFSFQAPYPLFLPSILKENR